MAMPTEIRQNRKKLIEAVIYLCQRSVDDPNFGMTKLVKLLYYADCASYAQVGAPITGTTYLHFPHGPFPENWYQVREQMAANGDVSVEYDTAVPGYTRYRLRPLRAANLELISRDELAILDEQVKRFASFNTAGIEEYAHQEVSWLATEDGQPMDYDLSGIVSAPLSERELQAILDELPF